jgi:hypothetical protein
MATWTRVSVTSYDIGQLDVNIRIAGHIKGLGAGYSKDRA